MSGSGGGKGWLGSKRRVLCGYCSLESRYDNLKRHIQSVHGNNMQFKYKVIEVTESVKNFLVKKVEDNNNEEIVKVDEEEVVRGDTIQDELYQPPDDDLGIGGTVSTVGAGGEDDSETDNEEDGSSKDTGENRLKRKGEQSVPANPSIKVPRIEIETFENKSLAVLKKI